MELQSKSDNDANTYSNRVRNTKRLGCTWIRAAENDGVKMEWR